MPLGHHGTSRATVEGVSDSVDLDLRVVRYFVAVAEHGHFGRAAAALHITQPSLSRQIRGLEKQVGAALLHRSAQGSALTDAGQVFLTRARDLLDDAARTLTHTRAAARPRRITIGYTTNLVVTPAVRELRDRCPDADVRVVHLPWNGAYPALMDHRVDIAVTRLPIPRDGIETTVLYREDRVLLLSRRHRLAHRTFVEFDDIATEPMPRVSDPVWDAFWRVDPRPDGRPAPDGPLLDDVSELFDYLAEGRAVLIAPADSRAPDLQPELMTIPLRGIGPGEVALARRHGETTKLVDIFTDCAAALLGPGEPSPRRRPPGPESG